MPADRRKAGSAGSTGISSPGMDSSASSMAWSRPVNLWLAPVLLLALGVFVILADGLGLESSLSNKLFDTYQRHAARPLSDMSFSDGVSVAVPVPIRVDRK